MLFCILLVVLFFSGVENSTLNPKSFYEVQDIGWKFPSYAGIKQTQNMALHREMHSSGTEF